MRYLVRMRCALTQRMTTAAQGGTDRGDVPGWVLVTLMTAGLVASLWLLAGPTLENLFVEAIEDVRP